MNVIGMGVYTRVGRRASIYSGQTQGYVCKDYTAVANNNVRGF